MKEVTRSGPRLNSGFDREKNGGARTNISGAWPNSGGARLNNGGARPNSGVASLNSGGARLNSGGATPNSGGHNANSGGGRIVSRRRRKNPLVSTYPEAPVQVEMETHFNTAPVIDSFISNG